MYIKIRQNSHKMDFYLISLKNLNVIEKIFKRTYDFGNLPSFKNPRKKSKSGIIFKEMVFLLLGKMDNV